MAQLNPPQALPNYMADLAHAVAESQAWIATRGLIVDDTVKIYLVIYLSIFTSIPWSSHLQYLFHFHHVDSLCITIILKQ